MLDRRATISQEAIAQEVSDEVVILDLGSEQYFSLDPVGARIWALIGEYGSLGQVFNQLLSEYEVSEAELKSDLETLVQSLVAEGLVVLDDPLPALPDE